MSVSVRARAYLALLLADADVLLADRVRSLQLGLEELRALYSELVTLRRQLATVASQLAPTAVVSAAPLLNLMKLRVGNPHALPS